MGCAASYFIYDLKGATRNGAKQTEPARKRNFSNRFEWSESSYAASTGETSYGSGRYTSTSGSNWNDSGGAPTTAPRIIAKSNNKQTARLKLPTLSKLSPKDMPKVLARLTLSDKKTKREDMNTVSVQRPQTQVVREHSSGYSTGDTRDLNSTCSSLSYNSFLLHTQDMSASSEESRLVKSLNSDTSAEYTHAGIRPKSNIVMEIRMVNKNTQVMPKTSSPFCGRRALSSANSDISYNDDTYYLWREYLEEQRCSRIRDITAIPEAVAGLFSPADHPAYTHVNNYEFVSAPKRYRASQKRHTKSTHRQTKSSGGVPLALVGPNDYLNQNVIISTEL